MALWLLAIAEKQKISWKRPEIYISCLTAIFNFSDCLPTAEVHASASREPFSPACFA